jgi:hypothetical protein
MEMLMHRRNLLTGTFSAAGALLAAATSAVRAKAADPDKSKVVYHLTDLDKVGFVLGNIRNHFDGVGGPDKVTIALVVHGPALKASTRCRRTPRSHAASASSQRRRSRSMPAATP